jgi:hypothetical protein
MKKKGLLFSLSFTVLELLMYFVIYFLHRFLVRDFALLPSLDTAIGETLARIFTLQVVLQAVFLVFLYGIKNRIRREISILVVLYFLSNTIFLVLLLTGNVSDAFLIVSGHNVSSSSVNPNVARLSSTVLALLFFRWPLVANKIRKNSASAG